MKFTHWNLRKVNHISMREVLIETNISKAVAKRRLTSIAKKSGSEIIDEYVEVGGETFFIRPSNIGLDKILKSKNKHNK